MSVESATAIKEIDMQDENRHESLLNQIESVQEQHSNTSTFTNQQKEHFLKQLSQLKQDLDEKFMPCTISEKSDHEKLGKRKKVSAADHVPP